MINLEAWQKIWKEIIETHDSLKCGPCKMCLYFIEAYKNIGDDKSGYTKTSNSD